MPKNPQIQQSLDRVKVSRVSAEAEIRDALTAAIPLLAKAASRAAEIRADAQLAELLGDDEMLRPKFGGYSKTAGRIQEHCREAETACAKIIQAIRQLGNQDAELREIAAGNGYVA